MAERWPHLTQAEREAAQTIIDNCSEEYPRTGRLARELLDALEASRAEAEGLRASRDLCASWYSALRALAEAVVNASPGAFFLPGDTAEDVLAIRSMYDWLAQHQEVPDGQ